MATVPKRKVPSRREEHLPTFVWTGIDRGGRRVQGEMAAPSEAALRAILRKNGVRLLRARQKKEGFSLFERIRPKDIAYFTRQLATLISAGVPLVQALDTLAQGATNRPFRQLLFQIRDDVASGSSLSQALRKHPAHFDKLYCNLVAAAESSGTLDLVLNQLADYKERIEAIKGKVKKALFYPAVVIFVAVAVMAILLVWVIPMFEQLFKSFGADLPAYTRMVINLSHLVSRHFPYIVGTLLVAIGGLTYAKKRSERVREVIDRLLLKFPILGPEIFYKSAIARFARTLATTVGAGVPLLEALTVTAGATGNAVFEKAILKLRELVASGTALHFALQQTGLFPHIVTQMVAIGEEAGSLEQMLGKVADFYEEEVNNAVDAFSSLIEPLIIIVIGIGVGGLVIAMYLPIFKLGMAIG